MHVSKARVSPFRAAGPALGPIVWLLSGLLLGAAPAPAKPAGPGQRNFLPPVVVAPAGVAKKVVVADWNGDGKNDFAVLHWDDDGRGVVDGVSLNKGYLVRVYLNTTPAPTPNPTFAQSAEMLSTADDYRLWPMYDNDLAVGDFNGDGIPDLVVASSHADRVYVYLGKGDGTFGTAIETATEDDPCYVAAGDFDGDGKTDIALLHMIRGFPGSDYQWRFAFLFGKGDGTFERKITRDEWKGPFAGGRGPGPYYYSTTWDFETAPAGKWVGGAYRDAVWINHRVRWFDGSSIQGDFDYRSFFDKPWGSKVSLASPAPPALFDKGGRVIAGRAAELGDSIVSFADDSLDRVFLDATGNPRAGHFGEGVVGADFDNDGVVDLAMISDETGGPGGNLDPSLASYSFLIAYGNKDPRLHPLDVGAAGFDPARFREIWSGGMWRYGHRPWHTAVADFNLDGYPDLITVTAGGVVIHPNQGLFGFQFPPPILDEVSGLGTHPGGGTAAGDPLTLYGTFDVGNRPVTSMVLASAAPARWLSVLVQPDKTFPGKVLHASLPPDDVLKPGDYLLSVTNGTVESVKKVPVKVVPRALEIDSLAWKPLPAGAASAELAVRGWFGNSDLAATTFTLELTGKPGTALSPAVTQASEGYVVLGVPTSTPPGSYTLSASNPGRLGAAMPGVAVDFSPVIAQVSWHNPGGPGWVSNPALPIAPGAAVDVEGRNLRAPDVLRWSLVRGGLEVAQGKGALVTRGAIANDNTDSVYELTLDAGAPEGDATLRLISTNGLASQLAGPFHIQKGTGGGGGGAGLSDFYFSRESKSTTICDTLGPIWAKDIDGAFAQVWATVMDPDGWEFGKIDASEMSTACHWKWEYDIYDSMVRFVGSVEVEAASGVIADQKADVSAPSGGNAVYKAGPIK